jgi:hypothetical protein
MWFPAADTIAFSEGGTEVMRIDSSGNVGIGTTSPANVLQVVKSQTADTAIVVSNAGTANAATTMSFVLAESTTPQGWFRRYRDGTGITEIGYTDILTFSGNVTGTKAERMRIDSSGNVCIGTTSNIASGKTSILFAGATENGIELKDSGTNSGAAFLSFRNSSNTQIGSITRNGTTNAVLFNTTSDERLKSNVVDANPVLDKLMQVQVRQYDWTEGDLHQDAGFIAQELAPVLSGIVTQGKTEEDMWQLDYSRLTPYLTKAIQEQQTIINDLKARITALEGAA